MNNTIQTPPPEVLGSPSGSPLSDRQRWELCGKPEIICADDGYGENCFHVGPDVSERCCEICGRDEPEEETDECPDCKVSVRWVPKCPECGLPATWTYGEIKPMEFERIKSSENAASMVPGGGLSAEKQDT